MNYFILFVLSLVAFQVTGSSAQNISNILKNTIKCLTDNFDNLTDAEKLAFAKLMNDIKVLTNTEEDFSDCLDHLGDPPLVSEAVDAAECIGNVIVDPPTPLQSLLYEVTNGMFRIFMIRYPNSCLSL